jgi:hypothetical protein
LFSAATLIWKILRTGFVPVAITFPVLVSEHLSRDSRDYVKVRRSRCKMRQPEDDGARKPSRGDLGLCIRIYRCGVGMKHGLSGIRISLLLQKVWVKQQGRWHGR